MTTTMNGIGARERTKLAAILAMLSSDYEQERATAGLMATAFLRRYNLDWRDVAALAEGDDPAPASPAGAQPPAHLPQLMCRQAWHVEPAQWRGYERRRSKPAGQFLDTLI
jgi:hypothetical protein